MEGHVLRYAGGTLQETSEAEWKQEVLGAPGHIRKRLGFMTPEHHAVRRFAVRQLPLNQGRPLTLERLAQGCSLPIARVKTLVDDLERHLFFLVRNSEGHVSWAFPVTVEPTPHSLVFDRGERLFGA